MLARLSFRRAPPPPPPDPQPPPFIEAASPSPPPPLPVSRRIPTGASGEVGAASPPRSVEYVPADSGVLSVPPRRLSTGVSPRDSYFGTRSTSQRVELRRESCAFPGAVEAGAREALGGGSVSAAGADAGLSPLSAELTGAGGAPAALSPRPPRRLFGSAPFGAPKYRLLQQSPGEQAGAMAAAAPLRSGADGRRAGASASAQPGSPVGGRPVQVMSLDDFLRDDAVGCGWEEATGVCERCYAGEAAVLENERVIMELQVSMWCGSQRQRVSEAYLNAGNVLCQLQAPAEYSIEDSRPATAPPTVSFTGHYRLRKETHRALPVWERAPSPGSPPAILTVGGDRRWMLCIEAPPGESPQQGTAVSTHGECSARLPHEVDDWPKGVRFGPPSGSPEDRPRHQAAWLRAEEAARLQHQRSWLDNVLEGLADASVLTDELLAGVERCHEVICPAPRDRPSSPSASRRALERNAASQKSRWDAARARARALSRLGDERLRQVRACNEQRRAHPAGDRGPWSSRGAPPNPVDRQLRENLRRQAELFKEAAELERELQHLAAERWRIVRARIEAIEQEQTLLATEGFPDADGVPAGERLLNEAQLAELSKEHAAEDWREMQAMRYCCAASLAAAAAAALLLRPPPPPRRTDPLMGIAGVGEAAADSGDDAAPRGSAARPARRSAESGEL